MKPRIALYVGGMGARSRNFYQELALRYGYEAEARRIQDLYLDGRKREAAAAVPDALVDEVCLVGNQSRIAERVAALPRSGRDDAHRGPAGGRDGPPHPRRGSRCCAAPAADRRMDRVVPLALVAAFGVLTAFRALRVYRTTGVNPIKVGGKSDDPVQGVDGPHPGGVHRGRRLRRRHLRLRPGWKPYLVPIPWLEQGALRAAGTALGAAAIGWIGIAQYQMAASFRIGVDRSEKTALVRRGLYSLSRNPIYLGVAAFVSAFFLTAPNALTFGMTVAAFIGIAIQARLEEQYLLGKHPEEYRAYRSAVRRWL